MRNQLADGGGVRWHRLRYALLGTVVSVIAPYIVAVFVTGNSDAIPLLNKSVISSLFAAFFGVYLLRSMTRYPGVQSQAYVVPAFFISYTVLLIFFLYTRMPYSRSVITGGFVLSVVYFLVLQGAIQRRLKIRIGIVPFGNVSMLTDISSIEWVMLEDYDELPKGINGIVIDFRANLPDTWERKLAGFALLGIPVFHVKNLYESLTGRVQIDHISENDFGTLTPVSAYMRMKHAADFIAAFLALVLLVPIFIVVAVAIKIDGPGQVLFRQVRIGYRGRPFRIFKFRTMVERQIVENDRDDAVTQASDKRVTRIGRFLRRSRIDELPQLLNVLRGEMSWIGPRPEAELLSYWYRSEIPFYEYRHIVRPGIAGWAQVNQGHVADITDVKEKLYYDFYYIRHYSMWIDFLIVGKTVRTMLTGFGSK